MRLAASNIAWPVELDAIAAEALLRFSARGVEVAPSRVWSKPVEATEQQASEYRAFWAERNISIVAMQSLLFNEPGLALFGSEDERVRLKAHLEKMIRLAGWLGSPVLVFGAPQNRRKGEMAHLEAWEIAVGFFSKLGKFAFEHGTCLCIEAVPKLHGCDFVNDSVEAEILVSEVRSPGFGIHLDDGSLALANEDAPARIQALKSRIRHFHLSEPKLAAVGPGGTVDHRSSLKALEESKYPNWVSIEMREDSNDPIASLERALEHVRRLAGA